MHVAAAATDDEIILTFLAFSPRFLGCHLLIQSAGAKQIPHLWVSWNFDHRKPQLSPNTEHPLNSVTGVLNMQKLPSFFGKKIPDKHLRKVFFFGAVSAVKKTEGLPAMMPSFSFFSERHRSGVRWKFLMIFPGWFWWWIPWCRLF